MAATRAAAARALQPPDAAPCAAAWLLLAAALALPGVMPATAHRAGRARQRHLRAPVPDYRDWQPGAEPHDGAAPRSTRWCRSPIRWRRRLAWCTTRCRAPRRYIFNALSGASIGDYRTAGDIKVTKYFEALGGRRAAARVVGAGFPVARRVVQRALFGEDRNRTWSLGVGGHNDRINATNGVAPNSPRNSLEFLVGVTQALSPHDIVQSNLTYYTGHGYYTDPYKSLDTRPTTAHLAWLTRYNHYFAGPDATLRSGTGCLRFVRQQHEHVRGRVGAGAAGASPSRRHCATARRPLPTSTKTRRSRAGYVDGQNYTADTRLASWGAITAGSRRQAVGDGWTASLRADYYRQDPDWQIFGAAVPTSRSFPRAGSS